MSRIALLRDSRSFPQSELLSRLIIHVLVLAHVEWDDVDWQFDGMSSMILDTPEPLVVHNSVDEKPLQSALNRHIPHPAVLDSFKLSDASRVE
jgi:hypothetical protein